jgi:hypothetical protein
MKSIKKPGGVAAKLPAKNPNDERLVGKSRQPKNIVDFFRQSPLVALELDLERDRGPARDIDL